MALGYAAIALAILAIFLPLVMVIKVRQQATEQHYQVTGAMGSACDRFGRATHHRRTAIDYVRHTSRSRLTLTLPLMT